MYVSMCATNNGSSIAMLSQLHLRIQIIWNAESTQSTFDDDDDDNGKIIKVTREQTSKQQKDY